MKKRKKSKHREENTSNSNSSKEGVKQKIFKIYNEEMEEKTEEFIKKNPNLLDTKFYLFQTIKNRNLIRDMIFNLTYFYDLNFVGNKDFIHIPKITDILNNILKYPIMLSTKRDKYGLQEILGVSTIKIENNDSISMNPYFPTVDETVLTISGILAKQNAVDKDNNRIRGIGKELFKSSINAAYKINKNEKVRLICEVDCRNVQSFGAVSKAVKELQDEGLDIDLVITGYYEIINNQGNLTEAPTFVLEIVLNKNKNISNNKVEFNYFDCSSTELFSDLNNVIENNTKEIKQYVNIKNDKIVIYHNLESINALNVTLNIGNTANGNERVPYNINVLEYEIAHKDLI